jgi:hypothetical protein
MFALKKLKKILDKNSLLWYNVFGGKRPLRDKSPLKTIKSNNLRYLKVIYINSAIMQTIG